MSNIFALFGVRLRKNRFLLPFLLVAPILLLFATGTFRPAASDKELLYLRQNLEVFYPFFAFIPLCIVFNNKEEPSFIVLRGSSLIKVASIDAVLCFFAAYLSGTVTGLMLIPRWMIPYFLFSYPVTLLFVVCFALFVRFLCNFRYANIAVYSFAFLALYYNSGLSEKAVTETLCRFDPFLGGYAHGIFTGSNGMWYLFDEVYMQNRLFILTVSLLLLALAWLLSKQKRLYD